LWLTIAAVMAITLTWNVLMLSGAFPLSLRSYIVRRASLKPSGTLSMLCLFDMNERADECKARALECERAAQEFATDLALSNLFLDLAHRWREMAKEVQHH
jgi:hypothetical protein